jgi:hypothetical protein
MEVGQSAIHVTPMTNANDLNPQHIVFHSLAADGFRSIRIVLLPLTPIISRLTSVHIPRHSSPTTQPPTHSQQHPQIV